MSEGAEAEIDILTLELGDLNISKYKKKWQAEAYKII
jgi:hypothetical protein